MVLLNFVFDHPILVLLFPILVLVVMFIYYDPPRRTRHASRDQFSAAKIKTPSATFEMIPTNGIHLHTLCAGDPANPLVILLHGFPEFWKAWELQVDDLVNSGFYVMVPDQRGYNLSSKPLNMGDYKITTLVQDIIGLVDYAKRDKVYLAGHDWGAVIAWYLAMLHPDRFHKLLVVNGTHSKVFAAAYKHDKDQYKKSGYMRLFQIPFIPQRVIARNDFAIFTKGPKSIVETARPGAFSEEDIKHISSLGMTQGR